MSNFWVRLFTGILFVALLLGSVFVGELASSILFLIIILLCQREFYNLFNSAAVTPQKLIGIIGGFVFFLASIANKQFGYSADILFLVIPIVFLVFIFELFRKKPNPIANIGCTLLGIIYIAVPFTLLHKLAYYQHFSFTNNYNYTVLIGYFFILWANDTGAYLIGRSFGRVPLFERISPKKTREGAIGGGLMGFSMGYINSILFSDLNVYTWLTIAFIVVVFGSLGDLVESLLKRSLGVKDSSKLLPGHGGVLDRFDGILISAPMVYTYLKAISF